MMSVIELHFKLAGLTGLLQDAQIHCAEKLLLVCKLFLEFACTVCVNLTQEVNRGQSVEIKQ